MKRLAVLVALAACGTTDDAQTGDTFIAFSSSFTSFRDWTPMPSPGPADDGTYPADVLGARTHYINMLPPSGSSEFPIGTIIVQSHGTDLFARVKRGDNFNTSGAHGWEWFELKEGPVAIVWRGVGPPAGESYGGDPKGGCNTCHAEHCAANDYVCAASLQLSSF
jgi:hypothetical protein